MSDDHDLPDESDHDGPTVLDPARERALRDLLRTEPVAVDPTRRELSIQAALGAAEPEGTSVRSGSTSVDALAVRGAQRAADRRARRARQLRPLLVAAASVVVVAGGMFALWQSSGAGTDESASSGASDDAAETATMDATDPTDEGADEGAGTAAEAPAQERHDAAASTTDVADAQRHLTPLGDFDDAASLLDAAGAALGFTSDGSAAAPEGAEESFRGAPPEAVALMPCGPELLERGWSPVADATVRGEPVVVARTAEGTLVVLDAQGCEELDR